MKQSVSRESGSRSASQEIPLPKIHHFVFKSHIQRQANAVYNLTACISNSHFNRRYNSPIYT